MKEVTCEQARRRSGAMQLLPSLLFLGLPCFLRCAMWQRCTMWQRTLAPARRCSSTAWQTRTRRSTRPSRPPSRTASPSTSASAATWLVRRERVLAAGSSAAMRVSDVTAHVHRPPCCLPPRRPAPPLLRQLTHPVRADAQAVQPPQPGGGRAGQRRGRCS